MHFSNLPNEVLQHIFGFLDHKSRLTVLEVCSQWNALASSAQFMDRIWFRMIMWETNFKHQVVALKCSSRKYRHVFIDGEASRFFPDQSTRLKIAEMLTAVKNVETLVLFRLQDMTAADLQILLSNVSNLKRLCLLGQKLHHLHELCFSGLPNIGSWRSTVDQTPWTDVFVKQSGLVLQNVTDITLTAPFTFNIRVDVFQQMFPNLNQLQVAVKDPSIVHLIDAYKSQLDKLSIFSITFDLFTLFCGIKFSKLSHFYLNITFTLNQMSLTKCESFFKILDHTRNLRYLKLFVSNTSIIKTICSNCTFLRVLEVFTTDIDFLENISYLRNLQKLSIRGRDDVLYLDQCDLLDFEEDFFPEEFHNQQPAHVSDVCQPIQSLKVVEINESFRSANELPKLLHSIAPNLEVLALENIQQPEEGLRILSETAPNIRHLKLSFKHQIGKPPRLNFGYLMSKTNLTTYTLVNVLIDDDSIPKWIQMAPNLSTIVIANCETLNAAHLTIFNSCCPKLRQLELKGCKGITAQALKEIKQVLPLVAIVYQDKYNIETDSRLL